MIDKILGSLTISIFLMGSVQASDLDEIKLLDLKSAQRAVNIALRTCQNDDFRVSVAVVDRSGNLLTQSRHPLAGPHTVGSSFGKAFTSASMGQPTANLANAIAQNPALAWPRRCSCQRDS